MMTVVGCRKLRAGLGGDSEWADACRCRPGRRGPTTPWRCCRHDHQRRYAVGRLPLEWTGFVERTSATDAGGRHSRPLTDAVSAHSYLYFFVYAFACGVRFSSTVCDEHGCTTCVDTILDPCCAPASDT
jgi:hypothetical protein